LQLQQHRVQCLGHALAIVLRHLSTLPQQPPTKDHNNKTKNNKAATTTTTTTTEQQTLAERQRSEF
jgi:hypothetical protein